MAARSAAADRCVAVAGALYLTITESVAACEAAAGMSKMRATAQAPRTAVNIESASRLIGNPPPRRIPLPASAQSQSYRAFTGEAPHDRPAGQYAVPVANVELT